MNLRMKYFHFLPATALAAVMAACGGNETPVHDITEAITASSFSYVTDQMGVGRVFAGPTYRVSFDNDDKTATVKMENVVWADGTQAASYVFTGVEWKFNPDNKARVIDCARLIPDGAMTPVISDLEITMYEPHEFGDKVVPGMSVSYTVDGKYDVTNVPYRTMFTGATETVNSTDNSSFETTKTTYAVDIDPNSMTAVLKITNAAFAENMPSLNMEFPGLIVNVVDGGYRLHSEMLIPTIAGTPYPRFAITDFEMDVELDGDSRLEFGCMTIYKVEAFFEAAYTPVD